MSNIIELFSSVHPVLKQGAQGEWVTFLQDSLNGCGCSPLDLDGDFGTQTLSVVNQFQRKQGLSATGVVDAATWEEIATHPKQFGWQAQLLSEDIRTGIAGADTISNVTATMIQKASEYLAAAPRFWGRYFQAEISDGEYLHQQENTLLRQAGIRVVPISRWTNRVNGFREDGTDVGQKQAGDLLETFGENYLASQGDGFYFFLDVEGVDGQPSLSQEFYLGWSEAVAKANSKVQLMPCVYLNGGDCTTLRNLSAAVKAGAECHGLWVANYGNNNPWLQPWSTEAVRVSPSTPCKVLIHQYASNTEHNPCDLNQINPFLEHPELVIKRLILPPQN